MSRLLAGLLLTAILAGCAVGDAVDTTGPSAEATEDLMASLREGVAGVATTQATADAALADVLDAVRAVDRTIPAVRSPTSYQEALDGYGTVHVLVEQTSPDGLRDDLFAVANAVDEARATLARAQASLDDPWEVEYLAAEDAVLVAVRAYAEAADRLAQLLQQHWPTYVALDQEIVAFTERLTVERTPEEGVSALAIELEPHLADLVVAQAQIAEVQRTRAEAADRVNAAATAATEVYAGRPDGASSPPAG